MNDFHNLCAILYNSKVSISDIDSGGVFLIPAGACEKVASDLWLSAGFLRLFQFPTPLSTG